MKKTSLLFQTIALVLASSIILTSCSSTTLIQSTPHGAKVYVDGEPVGTTPYSHTDTKIVGSTTTLKLEKEGYETFNTTISRNEEVDVGAIIGGLFVWIPFLWTMKYKPTHTYEMVPASDYVSAPIKKDQQAAPTKSKYEKLRELKNLFDEGVINEMEYEKEKDKILNEEN